MAKGSNPEKLEPVSLKLPVVSELHKTLGMRIDLHVSFNMTDNGEALREKLGMSPSSFSRLRRGTKEITLTDLLNLAEFFNLDVVKIIKCNF